MPSLPHYSLHLPKRAHPIEYQPLYFPEYRNRTISRHPLPVHYPHKSLPSRLPNRCKPLPLNFQHSTLNYSSPPAHVPPNPHTVQNSLYMPLLSHRYPNGRDPYSLLPTYKVSNDETNGQTHPPQPLPHHFLYSAASSCHNYSLSHPKTHSRPRANHIIYVPISYLLLSCHAFLPRKVPSFA